MLSQQQQALVQAIQQLDLDQVQSLLADGLTRTLLTQSMDFLFPFYVMACLPGGKMSVKPMRLANRLLRQRNNSS